MRMFVLIMIIGASVFSVSTAQEQPVNLEQRIVELEKIVNTQMQTIATLQKAQPKETSIQSKERLKLEAKNTCDLWDRKIYTISVTGNNVTIICK
jgi:hypothetical protein